MSNQAFHISHSRSLYPQALRSLYGSARELIDTDLAQMKEPEIWDKFRQDAVCANAIDHRVNKIAGDEFQVVPPNNPTPEEKSLASLFHDALGEISGFNASQKLLSQGLFRGRAYGFPENSVHPLQLGTLPRQDWRICTRIRDVDKDRVQKLKRDDRWGWYLQPITGESRDPRLIERDAPLISLVWCDEERTLGYGWPGLRSAYFMWWAKMEALPLVLHGLERWAMGFVDVEIDENVSAGLEGRDSVKIRDDLIAELKKHRTDHIFAHSSRQKLNFHEAGGTGHEMAMGWINYVDTSLRGYFYGSPLPIGGNEGTGSLARAEVEQDVADTLVKSDRALKDEKMGGKIIRLLWEWNRPALQRLFPNQPRMPKFVTVTAKAENAVENAQVAAQLLGAGVKLKTSELYERTGWTVPEEGDDVVEGIPAAEQLNQGAGGFGAPVR